MLVYRHAMAAYEYQAIATGRAAANVERTAEGELLLRDMQNAATELLGDFDRSIRRARIHEYRFMLE